MADKWERAAFVENHPEDHAQRWRLAKKLYAEHEYRLALEHLNILHNEWTPRLNVERYLAATYYRLGRYAEAAEHLRGTIRQWPEEPGPCEQLAHVLQVDGKLEDSLEQWKQLQRLEPEHSVAAKSIAKIEKALRSRDVNGTVPVAEVFRAEMPDESDDGLPVTGKVCPQCGAQNSDEFDVCWQCNASLRKEIPSFLNTPPIDAHGTYLLRPETITGMTLVGILALLAGSAVLGIRTILSYQQMGDAPVLSLQELEGRILGPARIVAGLVMLFFWPMTFKVVLKLFRAQPYPPDVLVYLSGFFLGALTLLLILLPMPFPAVAVVLSLAISLGIVIFTFRIYVTLALAVWVTHIVLIWTLGLLSFWLAESKRFGNVINPFAELPAVAVAFSGPGAIDDAVPIRIPKAFTPIRQRIKWTSTGSEWLDTVASKIEITIRPEIANPALRFQIYQGADLRYHEDLEDRQTITVYASVLPGVDYEFAVLGVDDVIAQVFIQSLLPFEFLDAP